MLQRIWLPKLKVYHLIEDGPLVIDGIKSVRNEDHMFYRPMIELMPDDVDESEDDD